MAVAAVSFAVFGGILFGGPGAGSLNISVLGKSLDVAGLGPMLLHGVSPDAAAIWPPLLFAMLGAGFASSIAVGTGAERWRTAACLVSAAVMGALIFPLYAHWVWSGGWLAQFGALDAAGSGVIHIVGGLNALAVTWIAGPRRAKFNQAGIPSATPGHSAPYILFGCMLAGVGWIGLNIAGAVLFGHAALGRAPFVAFGTVLSGAAGALAAAAITRLRFGKSDPSLSANGFLAGLVASSSGCAVAPPLIALLIGMVAGTLSVYCIEVLELRLKIDDPAGAISVHALGGFWGLLVAGIIAGDGHFTGQLVAIATLLGAIFPLLYGIQRTIRAFVPFRAQREAERQGMDLSELGAGAYPEFMLHRDDFGLR
jgi:Amt family ammonium transporter